jgi:hypothetical protein
MMTTLSLQSRVTAAKEQVSCDLAGETVLLSLLNGQYFGLNAVGAAIWDLLQDTHTVVELRDSLLRQFPDVSPERCTQDLVELLGELEDADLVQITR